MKKFFIVLGSLFLALIVLVAIGIAFIAVKGTALDKASKAYVGPLTEVRASPGPFADVCHHAERQNDFRSVHGESDV